MKIKQQLFSLLLCAAVLVSLCAPAAAEGEGAGETYIALTWNGSKLEKSTPQIPANITEITAENVEFLDLNEAGGGWYIVRDNDVSYSYAIAVTGTVNLILADGCYLGVYGIRLKENSSLSIYAQSDGENMGKLKVNCNGSTDAGIKVNSGSTVTINGGEVTAHGSGGAGIGGYYEETGGTITINGGEVTATSDSGAGIGGGRNGAGSTITIHGGTVTATSQYGGAGIDGGGGGTITISGNADVTATGSSHGILGGGDVSLTGGTVKASSSSGRGNGISGGTITISGSTVEAGGGRVGISSDGSINVTAGKVTANGSDYGIYSLNAVTISGGEVTAAGTSNSSSGYGIRGRDNMTISGGTVTATGTSSSDYGIGILVNNMTISGGTVTATGTSGSGSGYGIQGSNNTTISGGTVTATGTSSSSQVQGIDGSFSTGTGGSAFIAASSIEDNSGEKKEQWSGVIFEGGSGKVYGSEITLATDATISKDTTLEIEEGQTLAIGEDVTLTNNGTITGSGTIKGKVINNGTIEAGITVQDHTHQWDTAWSSDATNHWHRCTVTGCGERSDTAAHTPGDWVIDQTATSTEAGQRHKACAVCGYVTATETIPATGGDDGGGDYTPPTYKPEVSKPSEGGGTPSISPSKPEKGDTVTVTPKPDEGYEVERITVTDRNGKPVEVTKKPDGTYTFTQPAGTVTIEVSYVPLADLPDGFWVNPFADVSEGDWYYEAVRFVHERGLMNGYEDGLFGPNDTLSRAQLAQILFNKEGRPVVNYLMDFSDVAGEAWYAEAIRWATSQGIVGGYGDGTFGPDDPITREQLAVMLWRYSGSPAAADKELHFNDTDEISGFALEAMRWAVENGILNGYGDGRLDPQGQATRAQVAQMLKNFIENQEENT